jgi:hypothetical protein
VVDLRAIGKCCGQSPLKGFQLRLQGADAAVELAVAYEIREVGAEVRVCELEEVPLAAKAGSLREDGEGKDLGIRE